MSHLLKCRHALPTVRVILFPVEEKEGALGEGMGRDKVMEIIMKMKT